MAAVSALAVIRVVQVEPAAYMPAVCRPVFLAVQAVVYTPEAACTRVFVARVPERALVALTA
jgi:hypothetical protein